MLIVKKILFIVSAREIVCSIIYWQRQSYQLSNKENTVKGKYMSCALKHTESKKISRRTKIKANSLQNQVAH